MLRTGRLGVHAATAISAGRGIGFLARQAVPFAAAAAGRGGGCAALILPIFFAFFFEKVFHYSPKLLLGLLVDGEAYGFRRSGRRRALPLDRLRRRRRGDDGVARRRVGEFVAVPFRSSANSVFYR